MLCTYCNVGLICVDISIYAGYDDRIEYSPAKLIIKYTCNVCLREIDVSGFPKDITGIKTLLQQALNAGHLQTYIKNTKEIGLRTTSSGSL